MATRYKKFLQICQMWPLDPSKQGRDIGVQLRQQVGEAFRLGEASQIADSAKCDAYYEALRRIVTNHHGNKFHRARVTGAMGFPADKISQIMSTNMLALANERRPGMIKQAWNFIRRRPAS